jgi:hypothetical protein
MATQTPDPDLSKLSGEMYRAWEGAMTQWWDQVLESPAFVRGMGQNLANQSKARADYESAVDQGMESMHLPTRKDLVRVAKIVTLLEDRLLGMEDRLLELEDKLVASEKETLQARIEAAEARIEAAEKLAAMDSKLDQLLAQTKSPATPKPATRSRARKAPAKKA